MAGGGTATTETIARVNRTKIVELLRSSGPLTRAEIAESTGLSTPTTNRLTNSLIRDGLLRCVSHDRSTGGRPAALLQYTGGSRAVVALRVRREAIVGALVDFDGAIVARHEAALPIVGEDSSLDSAQRLVAGLVGAIRGLVDHFSAQSESLGTHCSAVGIALPGIVEPDSGEVSRVPGIGSMIVPLAALLRDQVSLPTVIENDANAMAYGEFHAHHGDGVTSLVGVLLDHGIGAGIIANGELYRGMTGKAGEIGFVLTDRRSLQNVYSDYGALEAQLRDVRLVEPQRPAAPLDDGAESSASLGAAGTRDDETDAVMDTLALAFAAIIVVLDPELVTLDIAQARHGDVIDSLRSRLSGRIPHVPEITVARPDAVLLGVAELAAKKLLGFTYIS